MISATDIPALLSRAIQDHQGGRFSEAEEIYRQILIADPRHVDALQLLGTVAHQTGRHDIAIELLGRAIALNDRVPEFHCNMGAALYATGNTAAAETSYRRALELRPDYAEAHDNLGVLLSDQGEYEEAIAHHNRAIAVQPRRAEAHNNLGHALQAQGKLGLAIASYRQAIALDPDYAAPYNNLGSALQEQGRLGEAMALYRQAIARKPDFAAAYSNLGHAREAQGSLEEAMALYRKAIACDPTYAIAHNNLGHALQAQGKVGEAMASYRQAIALRPFFAEAHANLGNALLLSGRYEEGWPEYEWRWRAKDFPCQPRGFAQRLWSGEEIGDRVILLHAEQGLGDTIQFCRYVPLVAAHARVILEIPRSIVNLLSPMAAVAQIVAKGDPLPAFDLHCPLGSLPMVFGTTRDSIPAPLIDLKIDPDRVATWRSRLPSSGLRVGICWQGSPTYTSDRERSAPLSVFAPLAQIPGVRLVSLQKQHGLEQLERFADVLTLGDDFDAGPDAFLDTAAAVLSLDLIVAIDSAVAHVAGTLGRPVWLALAAVPHWPWMLERADTPWYPAMRLFRQTVPGDWREPFARIAAELTRLARSAEHRGEVRASGRGE